MSKKIGILGGGQLGRMFIQNSLNYPFEIYILDPSENAPCAKIADFFQVGSFKDYETVLTFGRKVDVLTIEIEHVNVEALFQLEKEGIEIIPTPKTIETIKDKGLQKQFYIDNNITTSPFRLIENKEALTENLDFLPVFQKARTDGYDGKGVTFLKDKTTIEDAFDVPSVLEKAVEIDKELSVIVVANKNGEITHYPVVELVFDPVYNLVDYLIAPAEITTEQNNTAIALAKKVVAAFNSPGIFAVELFLDKNGEILVNEIAPRTHNSGHHSIEACFSSQYDNHLRAVLNFPLGNTELKTNCAAILNIVGEEGYTGKAIYKNLEKALKLENVYVHLYGKEVTKPGRKMGHFTILGNDKKEILEKIELIKKSFQVIA